MQWILFSAQGQPEEVVQGPVWLQGWFLRESKEGVDWEGRGREEGGHTG